MYPSHDEIHQELQPSINAVKVILSLEVHVRDDTVNDPLQDNFVVIGDVPKLTNIWDDPLPKFVSAAEVSSPITND